MAAIAANFATPLCRALIETGNALTQALTGEPIASRASLGQLLRLVNDAVANPGNPLLIGVIALLLAVLVAMLLVAWIVRLITLIVLVGVAPAALACHALPYTDAAARLWWRAMLGCVSVVVLQALALHTTFSILLDPAANRPALGVPNDPTGVFNLFIVACLLWVTVRIPALVRRYVMTGGPRSIAGDAVRLVVVQQLTRGLDGRVRHRPRAALASGAARATRPAAELGPGGRRGR